MKVKSYEIGYDNTEQAKVDAAMNGYPNVGEWLLDWFNEINDGTVEYTIQEIKNTYGYMGDTLAEQGNIRIKDIYGQIMVDEEI